MLKIISDKQKLDTMEVGEAVYEGYIVFFNGEVNFCIQKSRAKFGFTNDPTCTERLEFEAKTQRDSMEKAIAAGEKLFVIEWDEMENKFSGDINDK